LRTLEFAAKERSSRKKEKRKSRGTAKKQEGKGVPFNGKNDKRDEKQGIRGRDFIGDLKKEDWP